MTREEEICKAARHYVSGVTLSSPSDVIHFENGAKWADKNPPQDVVNLNDVWHDASEEPTCNYSPFLYQDTCGVFWLTTRKSVNSDWKYFVEENFVSHWAYISDLLPRNIQAVIHTSKETDGLTHK